jgi:hypothetical protein
MDLTFKLPVILILVIIIFSLFGGMYYLSKDDGSRDKTRVVRALTIRIVLSFILFFILKAGYFLGWFQPHSLT